METSNSGGVAARMPGGRPGLAAEETARLRLARELHDSVGAELAATHFALLRARASLARDAGPQCAEALADLERSLGATVDAVRQVLDGLSSPYLEDGLAAALAAWARSFGARTGLVVRFRCASGDERLDGLPADGALAVFRVAQEALANIARHARAAHADVRIECTPRYLLLTITDDGIGLPRSAARPSAHRRYGLAGMRERCAAFGGALRAGRRPAPETGTRVSARFAWSALLADCGASLAEGAAPLARRGAMLAPGGEA